MAIQIFKRTTSPWLEISRWAVEARSGVGSSNLEALRELDTTFFGPDQEAIASDSHVASADTLSTAKRVDRSVDDDKYFSDVDVASPPAPAAEGTDDLELAAIAADVLDLRSNECDCGTNHYLMFPEGQLVSLMIYALKRLSKQAKNMFVLGELTASLQTVSAAAGKRQHSFIYSCMGQKIRCTSFMKIHAIVLFTLCILRDQVEGGQVTQPLTNLLVVQQLMFMRVRHTRCSVNGCFGLLKKSFRSNEVESMKDCEAMINQSCDAYDALRMCWPWLEWDVFLAKFFLPVKGITWIPALLRF